MNRDKELFDSHTSGWPYFSDRLNRKFSMI
jgi:hypothetical protein